MESTNENKCPVCLIELGERNKFITNCGHTFCGTCFVSNLNYSIKCPMCRSDVVDVNDVQVPETLNGRLTNVNRNQNNSIIRDTYSELVLQQMFLQLQEHNDNGLDREQIKIQIINILHAFELDLIDNNQTINRRLSLSDLNYQQNIDSDIDEDEELDRLIATLEIPEN